MVTLQENAVKFNSNLIVSHDGGRLSSDSGLILIDELMDAFQFTQLSKKIVRFNDSRKYWTHTNHKLLKQLVLQIVAGYNTDSAANILQHDPVLQTLSIDEPLASQSSISRFYDRVVVETILTLQVLNQDLIDKARLVRNDTNMIIVDVNSEDLLVIKPRTLQEMGDIAHQLGNRHLPAQFTENEMLVQYDYLVEALLKDLGIPYSHEDRKVNQAFRHIGHSHD